MKKKIIAVVLTVLTMLSLLALPISAATINSNYPANTTGSFIKYENEQQMLEDMTYVMTSENGMYKLYIDDVAKKPSDKYTTAAPTYTMAILNTVTGRITLSNPYNAPQLFATNADIGIRTSQIYVNYFQITSGKGSLGTLYSYNDCFAYDQGAVYKTSTGLRVDYSIGEESREFAVPVKISLQNLLFALTEGVYEGDDIPGGSMSKFAAETLVTDNFSVYDPYQKFFTDYILDSQEMVDIMISQQPQSAQTPLVLLPKGTFDSNFTLEILEAKLKKANPEYFVLPPKGEENAFSKDCDELWLESDDEIYQKSQRPNFKMTVNYDLTNDGLVATLDASSIVYDKDVYCLASISILPYFDTALMLDNDTGYFFIPDGSGTIVRFEDLRAKEKYGSLTGSLYGPDYAYYQISGKNSEPYTMPVFGAVNTTNGKNSGYLAIIESGDALASITANTDRNYASAYASFKYAEYDTYDLDASLTGNATSTTEITVVSKNFYDGEYKVNYKLLVDDEVAEQYGLENTYDNSYVGMAKLYRDYLTEKGDIAKIENPDEDVKLFIEVFGSIKVKEQILTFPVTVDKELTTFEDVMDIQKELSELGIDNTSYILKGFYNGGLNNKYPSKIKWQRVLGGKKGLNALLEDAEENGYEVAPEIDFVYSYGSNYGGYKDKKHAVKTLDNRYTTKRVYYAATQTFERTSGVAVSSASFATLFDKFVESIEDYDIKTLATRTLGSDLNSDFDKKDYYSREDSKNNIVSFLKYIKEDESTKSFNLIMDVGNSYAIPYADAVLSAPLDSSRYVMASEIVPFYGMVYHGSVVFTGNALNMEGDEDYMILRALESGSTLYYTIAKQNLSSLKFDSEYNKYYSVSYDFLKDKIVATYDNFNKVMGDKQDKYITDHRFLNDEDEGISVTYKNGTKLNNSLLVYVEYEGGEGFLLNYNSEEVIVTINENGKKAQYSIGALSYLEYSMAKGGSANE